MKNKVKGSIVKSSKSSYKIYYAHNYLCSCRTYDQAYYIRQEMQKNNWNTSKLEEIQNKYPEYYTKLLYFYQYINYNKKTGKWILLYPKQKTESKKLEHINYTNIEDALYERDFLIEHDWDYEVLIECIDDKNNPYYNMTLPPYPERKIRNIQRKTYKKELLEMKEMILKDENIRLPQIAEKLGVVDSTIRNWLCKYNTDFLDFKNIVLAGEDPFEKYTLQKKIYTPDLSPSKPRFKNYVSHHKRSTKNPYVIVNSNRESFGWYPTRKIAEKVSRELEKCNWDREQLNHIREKHGLPPAVQKTRNYIYPHGKKYTIKKQANKKVTHYGTYKNMEIAEKIRDRLIKYNWDKKRLSDIQKEVAMEYAEGIY